MVLLEKGVWGSTVVAALAFISVTAAPLWAQARLSDSLQ